MRKTICRICMAPGAIIITSRRTLHYAGNPISLPNTKVPACKEHAPFLSIANYVIRPKRTPGPAMKRKRTG